MTENKDSSTQNSQSKTAKQAVEQAPAAEKAKDNKTDSKASSAKSSTQPKAKISKIGVSAFILALAGAGGVGGSHYLLLKQNEALKTALTQQNTRQLEQFAQQLTSQSKQAFSAQQKHVSSAMNQAVEQVNEQNQQAFTELHTKVDSVTSKLQPSDWLLEEAEYLIRMASRTLWLEHNSVTASAILTDADQRLAQLDDPSLLQVRELIHQDIEQIKLLPVLQTEQSILALMGLANQVSSLPLAMVELPDTAEPQESLELSDDINDWRENLRKTWNKFLADFITVRRREANVEPLMAPKYQQHLRQNLALKIQQVQWSASQQDTQLYQKSLTDINQWVNEYFDVNQKVTTQFIARVNELKSYTIDADYPNDLASLPAIRLLLQKRNNQSQSLPKQKDVPMQEDEPAQTIQPEVAKDSEEGQA